jgi:uncharacterized protein involved in exopolysaccharide biosynthesis
MLPTAVNDIPVPSAPPTLLSAALEGALRRWRWLLAATLAGGIAGVPLALRLPAWYTATARMIPAPSHQASQPVAQLETPLGVVPDDTNGPGGAEGAADLGRLLSILHSRSLTDDTIRRFGLQEAYHARTLDEVRAQFWNRLSAANLQAKEGYVELTFDDQDPQRAAAVANYMAGQANEIIRRISSAAAAQERAFLEHRLDEVRRDLGAAEEQYTLFQQHNRIVNMDEQSHAVLTTMLGLKEQLIREQLELRRVRGFASRAEPAAIQARRQIRDLSSKLAELSHPDSAPVDIFTRLDLVPSLRLESERLARELKTRASVYELLIKEYELAKLAEVRDTQSYEILDAAVVPTKKSRPSRTFAVLGFALFGFVLAFAGGAARGAWPLLKRYDA